LGPGRMACLVEIGAVEFAGGEVTAAPGPSLLIGFVWELFESFREAAEILGDVPAAVEGSARCRKGVSDAEHENDVEEGGFTHKRDQGLLLRWSWKRGRRAGLVKPSCSIMTV